MGNFKFKPGDIVYHKATQKRGVIVEAGGRGKGNWLITWEDDKRTVSNEVELWSEAEYRKMREGKIRVIEGEKSEFEEEI